MCRVQQRLPPLGLFHSVRSPSAPPIFFLGWRAGFCLLPVNDDRLDPLRLLQTLLGVRRAQARNFHCFLQVMRKEKKVYKLERCRGRGRGGGRSASFQFSSRSIGRVLSISPRHLHVGRQVFGEFAYRECSFSSRELAARPISTGIHL